MFMVAGNRENEATGRVGDAALLSFYVLNRGAARPFGVP
jgi:hypothetical protein